MNDDREWVPPVQSMEAAVSAAAEARYFFLLHIAGPTPQSTRAIVNLRTLCENHLKGRYDLEVVDLMENPARAISDQVIAAPSLTKILPPPVKRFIGDLSRTEMILKGLDLPCPVENPSVIRA